jgi:chromosome segregation ATPase
MQNQLNNTVRRLEKENKGLNERLELNSKSMLTEAGGLEKKLERLSDERDRLKEENDNIKSERDRKLDDIKRQFDREKEVLKQKNIDLSQKNKQTEAKQTELMLGHETNRAKWDQEKSYLISAKEDAISELKNIQKRYENSVKEIERLKEQQKRNNWRMQNKERVGGIATNNPLMYKVGEGMLGRLNLGGAGGGLNRQPGNEVSMS